MAQQEDYCIETEFGEEDLEELIVELLLERL